jgi:hypothetical protein
MRLISLPVGISLLHFKSKIEKRDPHCYSFVLKIFSVTLKKHFHPYLILIVCLLLLSACKKDNNQQAVVTFNLNGQAKSYNIYTSSLVTYDTLGVQEKILTMGSPGVVAGPALNTGIELGVIQNLALPGSGALRIGAYGDALLDTACNTNSLLGCNGFFMSYYDPTIVLSPSSADTTGNIIITAFSTSPATVSGTFQWQLTDGLGNLYQVTNGKFTNVPYVNQ